MFSSKRKGLSITLFCACCLIESYFRYGDNLNIIEVFFVILNLIGPKRKFSFCLAQMFDIKKNLMVFAKVLC